MQHASTLTHLFNEYARCLENPPTNADDVQLTIWRLRVCLTRRPELPELLAFWNNRPDFEECLRAHASASAAAKGQFHPAGAFDIFTSRLAELEKRFACVSVFGSSLNRAVDRLAELLPLDEAERMILRFVLTLKGDLDEDLSGLVKDVGEIECDTLPKTLSRILALPAEKIRPALGPNGALARCGFVKTSTERKCMQRVFSLQNDFAERIHHINEDVNLFLRGMLNLAPPAELKPDDFGYLGPDLDLLLKFIDSVHSSRGRGANILIHGRTGTGKTQLVRAIMESLKAPLYEISSENEDGDPRDGPERFKSYKLAQAILKRNQAWLLFDDVEDVFNRRQALLDTGVVSKAWINRALETNDCPTFWITNDIGGIDPAFTRRFDIVLAMESPPRSARKNILFKTCGKLGAKALETLVSSKFVTPALVIKSTQVLCTVGIDSNSPEYETRLIGLIDQTLKAQGHRTLNNPASNTLPDLYDVSLINCQSDLRAVLEGLRLNSSARICLFGPPGTGKTAFASYVAEELERQLRLIRASDILSPLVGKTENNLANIFKEARDDGVVLLIDEIDSFLHSRTKAERGWEVTAVNEMLTQMENHDGIFIAATNQIDHFDPAAFRRFDLKLEFGYLSTSSAWSLLQRHCETLGFSSPEPRLKNTLSRLDCLTPGDFATTSQRHRFCPLASSTDYLEALCEECSHKAPYARKQSVGFGAVN